MMIATLHYFDECRLAAERLAGLLGFSCRGIHARRFPDGESLVQVATTGRTAILYRSLDHPNEKLVELLLAGSALRDRGASRVILVAPYLGYMRQDTAFRAGEAISQKVIGALIAAHFDGLVTVDPHLHRTASVVDVVRGIDTVAVSAAGALADLLRPQVTTDSILIGPDIESRPLVEAIAAPLGLSVLIGEKKRYGDHQVELTISGIESVRGRPVVLVDDLVSSGGTLMRCAELLVAAGAVRIDAVATHCLASSQDLEKLASTGISRLQSTDTVPGPTASTAIAPVLVEALRSWSV